MAKSSYQRLPAANSYELSEPYVHLPRFCGDCIALDDAELPDELPVKEADNADEGDGTHCTNTNDEIAIHSPRLHSQDDGNDDDDDNDDVDVDKNDARAKRSAEVDEGVAAAAAAACCRL